MDRIEDYEREIDSQDAFDDNIHRHFRADVSEGQPPVEVTETTSSSRAADSKWQGDVGDGLTVRVASEKLGLTPDPSFDPRYHGTDLICRDSKGELVVVESKFDKRGIEALNGDQMQPSWVERKALTMQNPDRKMYTPGNAELGAEIERVGADKIRRVVITVHPQTLEVIAYDGNSSGVWEPIGVWNAFEFDQPIFESSDDMDPDELNSAWR